jgi:hypothetical protein
MSDGLKSVAVSLGLSDEGGRTFQQEFDDAVKCSYSTRIAGFAICFAAGWLCNGLAIMWLGMTQFKTFAIYYTIGNIINLGGSFFLWGPCSQLKSMFDPIRAWASILYLASLTATIVVSIKYPNVFLVLALVLVQLAAYIWYCASYIPYGRTMLRSCLASCVRCK